MPRAALRPLARLYAAWLSPMPAARLAALRVLIGGYALVRVSVLFVFVLRRAARGDALVHPVGVMRLWPGTPSVAALSAVILVAAACGIAFVAGFRYRLAAPLFAGALLTILSYFNSFGMIYHSDQLMVLHTTVLAFAPAADAFSMDARRRERAGQPTPGQPHARYGWPVRLLCVLTVSVYALSGVAKVSAHGFTWALGEALRAQIGKDALRKQLLGEGAGILGAWVWRNAWLATGIGVATLAMELGAPLVLLHARARRVWAAFAFGMHWGILLIMGITFRYQLCGVAFASFFQVERLLPLLTAGRRRLERSSTEQEDRAAKPPRARTGS
jgi:hypothetical protein